MRIFLLVLSSILSVPIGINSYADVNSSFTSKFAEANILPHIEYRIGTPYHVNGTIYHPYFNQNFKQVGTASWYGDEFKGKRTANGDIFNPELMTAAHPTLPLPSIVKVTNLKNHESVYVLVNDRGPFVGHRCIDLSRAAAKALHYDGQGTTKVKIEYDSAKTISYLKTNGLYAQYEEKTPHKKRKA